MSISDFSKQLKEGTKKSHTMAENTSFVASFLRGVVDESKYRQLIANFYFIYHALESEMDLNKDNPFVPFSFPLGRAKTIAKSASGLEQNHFSPVKYQFPLIFSAYVLPQILEKLPNNIREHPHTRPPPQSPFTNT